MNIELKKIEYTSGKRNCFLTYATSIPVSVVYDKAVDMLCGFTEEIMRDDVVYSSRFPDFKSVDFDYDSGVVEFTVQRKYLNSGIIERAHTKYMNGQHYIVAYIKKEGQITERMSAISHEDYTHLSIEQE